MATPTQRYVNPAIAADSGTGAIGDPYGDLQFALNTATRNATNGDQFNIKAGTSEILAAALSFATYGTPTATAPCIIRGYTAAANDGGQGVISGNGSLTMFANAALDFIKLVDMRFTNCGSAAIITLDANIAVINCEIDTTSGSGLALGANAQVIGCYIHNTGGSGVSYNNTSCIVAFCTFRNETNDFTQAINAGGTGGVSLFNVIDIDGASHGINIASSLTCVMFNSIYSGGGTGTGIRNSSSGNIDGIIVNNTVEGFSGSGGIGIQVVAQNAGLVGYNLLFNNATSTSFTGDISISLSNNDVTGVSPFINAAGDDFDPVAGLSGGYPTAFNGYTATQQNLIRMAAHYAAGGGPGIGGRLVR